MWYKLQIHESSRSCCVEDLWLLIKFPPIRSCAFYLNCFSPLVVGKVTGISYHGLTSQVDRERGKERAEKSNKTLLEPDGSSISSRRIGLSHSGLML